MSYTIELDSRRLVGLEDDLTDLKRCLLALMLAIKGADLDDVEQGGLEFQVWQAVDRVCDAGLKVTALRGGDACLG
ncbi:MAG: hypothetical protein KDA48_04550 [Amphiplicatus sp.]|nr:hypothetical protein [Amphiplicatus sp.]HRX40090.1 hypothetical protein [Parvularculaceae bacterium]